MDIDGPGIYPYTKVITPDMVLISATDDDINIKSNRDSDYEPEDDDDNVFGAKKLTEGAYIYYALPEANILFAATLGQTAYDIIVKEIRICDVVHNIWSPPHHVIDRYDKATEKSMSNYDIHKTKIKSYNIAK